MRYDLDRTIDRRHSDSVKWQRYDDDILPLWVADMDFVSAQPILDALHERVDHGIFGYTYHKLIPGLCETIQERRVGGLKSLFVFAHALNGQPQVTGQKGEVVSQVMKRDGG